MNLSLSFLFLVSLILTTICHHIESKEEKTTINDAVHVTLPKAKMHTDEAKPSSVDDQIDPDLKLYNILVVTHCFRGHINPAAATVRRLTKRGYRVTVIALDACQELVQRLMPNIIGYNEMIISTDISSPAGNPFAVFAIMDDAFRLNFTIRLFDQLDSFISKSQTKFDVLYGDELLAGAVLAGRKHSIPTVSQIIGPLFPNAKSQPHFLERSNLLREQWDEKASFLNVVGSALLDGFMEIIFSYPLYNSLKQIHKEQGWEDPSFDYGRFPFSYIHRHSVLLSHGAPPISKKRNQHYQNVQSIGFVPDDVMYPPLSAELSDWLEKADGPVVLISLGTLTVTGKEDSKSMFKHLSFQDKFYFIWAVKKSVLIDLEISKPTFNNKRLFVGQYLPQGKILQHPKVKIFVTHCGANSMLDSIHAMKPMITHPGFRDQPIISNILLREKVAKLLKSFTYTSLEPLLDELLSEPTYSEMVSRLQLIKYEQYKLGGYKKAVEVIEQMAEGKILINRTMVSEDVFGIALYDVIAVWATLLVLVFVAFVGIVLCCCQYFRNRTKQSDVKPKRKLIKKD